MFILRAKNPHLNSILKEPTELLLPAKLLVPFLYPGYLSLTGSWLPRSCRTYSAGRSILSFLGDTVGYLEDRAVSQSDCSL